MPHFLEIADKIPWVMVPAIVIIATFVISVLIVMIRFLEPASKTMIVAMMLALSGWAILMRSF